MKLLIRLWNINQVKRILNTVNYKRNISIFIFLSEYLKLARLIYRGVFGADAL